MKIAIVAVTVEGKRLAEKIAEEIDGCECLNGKKRVAQKISDAWSEMDALICIMASGIVVRSIAPLVRDKRTDPCVLVLDQKGRHVISLLSGHLGGGNALAKRVATVTGGTPVITTASDVLGKTAIDLWAERNELFIPDTRLLTELTARFVDGLPIRVYCRWIPEKLPQDFSVADSPDSAEIIITVNKTMTSGVLCCIPKTLFLGIGCNRGTSAEDIETSFQELCADQGIVPEAFSCVCSIDVKNDEEGLLRFAEKHKLPTLFYSRDEINGVQDVSVSSAAMKAVGAIGVAEPTALLGAGGNEMEAELIVRKIKWKDVTMAVAERIRTKWD